MTTTPSGKPVLVVGSTGYIGGRLVPRLLENGFRVRAMARTAKNCSGGTGPKTLISKSSGGMLLTRLPGGGRAGCWAAYYLVHSMDSRMDDFARTDRVAAEKVQAAESAGMERIIYLGGLGEEEESLSHHLSFTGGGRGILRQGPVPVTVFRAAMIIGSGSASFEILRYLVEHLPVIVTPPWVHTPCQPIGVRNVLGYLRMPGMSRRPSARPTTSGRKRSLPTAS